jgi:hypothetical protein
MALLQTPLAFLIITWMISSLYGATTTLSTGGADSWNDGTWSSGVPSGSIDAEIASGVQADVNDGSTPSYTGNLFLRDGSKLTVANNATDMNVLGGVNISLHNATLDIDRNVNFSLANIHVTGNGVMELRDLSNNNLPTLAGNISGTGNLYFPGVYQNEALMFAVANDISGGLVFRTSSRSAVVFQAPGSAGQGNVTATTTSSSGYFTWIRLDASNVFADDATLSLSGTEGSNSGMGTSAGAFSSSSLLIMGSNDDTIGSLYVNGFPYGAGNYSGSAGTGIDYVVTWIDGSGNLTVTSSPADASAPTATMTVQDQLGGSATSIYPNEEVYYTVTFSEPIVSLSTADFENADAATISVESVAKVDDLNYTVLVKALEAGTLNLQVAAGAVIKDFFQNTMTVPSADDETLTVQSPPLLKGELGLWKPWANGGTNPLTGSAWSRGDSYRYIFITSGTGQATSTDIADYNNTVQASANSGSASTNLSTVTWKVVGSTATVDAKTNTETDEGVEIGVPVLLLDGFTIMATNNTDLWDGAPSLSSPLYSPSRITPFIDEDGNYRSGWVHTGTGSDGTAYSDEVLGSVRVDNKVRRGSITEANAEHWINRANQTKATNQYFYGMSEVLTIRSTIPPTGTIIRIE